MTKALVNLIRRLNLHVYPGMWGFTYSQLANYDRWQQSNRWHSHLIAPMIRLVICYTQPIPLYTPYSFQWTVIALISLAAKSQLDVMEENWFASSVAYFLVVVFLEVSVLLGERHLFSPIYSRPNNPRKHRSPLSIFSLRTRNWIKLSRLSMLAGLFVEVTEESEHLALS